MTECKVVTPAGHDDAGVLICRVRRNILGSVKRKDALPVAGAMDPRARLLLPCIVAPASASIPPMTSVAIDLARIPEEDGSYISNPVSKQNLEGM